MLIFDPKFLSLDPNNLNPKILCIAYAVLKIFNENNNEN